jgi:hypothetical protein
LAACTFLGVEKYDLRSPCQNEITHQESRISVDGSDATKTNSMQPELTGKYRCRLHD